MFFTDTHCHLYTDEFLNDLNEVIKRANEVDVNKFFFPAIDSSTHKRMIAIEDNFKGMIFSMMGLHPCSVKENWREELAIAEDWLKQRRFAAIGEIGLDFYWDKTYIEEQYEVFEIQMQWALDYNLPIVIHTRNAMQETIDAVKPFSEKGLTGIFHCFGDSYEMAKQIISMNFYLGIGGVVTYKKAGLENILDKISLDHIVLETDAPYLTPVPFRGKRNESSYIKIIAERVAAIKNIPVEVVAKTTTENAEKIFGY